MGLLSAQLAPKRGIKRGKRTTGLGSAGLQPMHVDVHLEKEGL
jgi:hypothetical protein